MYICTYVHMYILAICARGNSHKGASVESVEPHSLTCYHTYIIILCSLHCHTTLSVYACCYPTLLHAFFVYTSALDLFNLLYSTTLVPLPRSLSLARYTILDNISPRCLLGELPPTGQHEDPLRSFHNHSRLFGTALR